MTNEEMQNIANSIQEKLGQENSGLIADDLATIINDNTKSNSLLVTKDNEIDSLKQKNERLLTVNGNLLQQIPMGEESSFKKSKEKEDTPKYSMKDAFNEKGEFI